ncbi:MAG TPA: hypothetical protein VEL06_09595 [Haliangiales bacterium]|nr:hypothetical protein [Haliangiales bacterium]
MNLTIAWLAQGKIRVKRGDEPVRTVESRFGQSIRERAVRAQQRHGWKTQGEGERFLAGAMLWGRVPKDPGAVRVSITSLCRGTAGGQMLYSLETDDLCAVLAAENLGAEERRLWNKNDQRLSHLTVARDGAVACSVRHPFGTANIAVRVDEESGFSEVTEGDSVDTAPRWVPGAGRRLLFQSAGVGRNRDGHFAGLAPFSIQQLDLDSGEMVALGGDGKHDLLTPQMAGDGALYFIRRPHTTGREIHPLRFLKDVVLFPVRLCFAIFQYLQYFSMRYTGKKLTTAGGAQSREMNVKEMMIWGNMVSAEHAGRRGEEAPDLVPKTWQLVRQRPNGPEEIMAKGVLAYDLTPDGSVVYSNGSAIHVIDPGGKTRRIVVESLIEQVIVLDAEEASR